MVFCYQISGEVGLGLISGIGHIRHIGHTSWTFLCWSRWYVVISGSRSNIGYWSFITPLGLFFTVLLTDDGRSGSRSNIGYWPHVAKIATPIPLLLLLLLLSGIESNQT